MKLTVIQTVLLFVIVFALSRVYLRAREKNITLKTAFFWTIIWVLAAIAIILPFTTTWLARFLGIGRGVDVITYASLLLLFYMIFRLYVSFEEMRRDITTIVRRNALEKPLKKSKRKSR